MNKKFLVYSLVGLLNSFTITGLVLTNSKQAQSLSASENSQPARSVRVDSLPETLRERHFIEMMIPHHQDAIVMADLALSRGRRSEIKELAQAIKQAQTRNLTKSMIEFQNAEIAKMQGWQQSWN
jgi:uncharacterized protein (DUF305 family)